MHKSKGICLIKLLLFHWRLDLDGMRTGMGVSLHHLLEVFPMSSSQCNGFQGDVPSFMCFPRKDAFMELFIGRAYNNMCRHPSCNVTGTPYLYYQNAPESAGRASYFNMKWRGLRRRQTTWHS